MVKMKKLIVLSVFVSLSLRLFAQTYSYDVNVYSNSFPFVKYTPPERRFDPNTQMQIMSNEYIELQKLQLEREKMERMERLERQRVNSTPAPASTIVSDEVMTINGTNLATKVSTPIKVRVKIWSNGEKAYSCLGIKKGNTWQPCEKSIDSLQYKYRYASSEAEKSLILELMDMGNYLLDTGTDVYVFKQ